MAAPRSEGAAGAPGSCAPCPGVRWIFVTLGCACVALGVVGMALPVMPTTVFLIIAAWAFSRGSPRLCRWLFDHPTLGRTVRGWHETRAISVRAKIAAVAGMAVSFGYVTLFLAEDWVLPAALLAVLGSVSAYILTRPSPEALGGACEN